VVSAGDRLVVGSLVERTISDMGATVGSRASHVSVVARAVVVVSTRSKRSVTSSRGSGGWDSSNLWVTELAVAVLALPKLTARASSVVIGGARTKALLLLVVTTKEHLHRDGEKEKECSDDSDRKAGSVQAAGGAERGSICDLVALVGAAKALLGTGGSVTKRSVDVSGAARCTITGEDCNSNHGTAAESVEDQTEEGKESLSAKAACEDNRADGVQDRRAGETLYGLLPARNGNIAVSLDGKEVGVDSKNDCSAAEFKGIECRSNELQRSTAESHCR